MKSVVGYIHSKVFVPGCPSFHPQAGRSKELTELQCHWEGDVIRPKQTAVSDYIAQFSPHLPASHPDIYVKYTTKLPVHLGRINHPSRGTMSHPL
jgi:hypothetical protein